MEWNLAVDNGHVTLFMNSLDPVETSLQSEDILSLESRAASPSPGGEVGADS